MIEWTSDCQRSKSVRVFFYFLFFCHEIQPNFGAVIFVPPNQLHILPCLLEIKFLWATPLGKAQTFSFNCDQHLYSRFLQKDPLFTKFTYQLRLLTGPYPNPLVSLIIYSFKYINKRSRSKHTGKPGRNNDEKTVKH